MANTSSPQRVALLFSGLFCFWGCGDGDGASPSNSTNGGTQGSGANGGNGATSSGGGNGASGGSGASGGAGASSGANGGTEAGGSGASGGTASPSNCEPLPAPSGDTLSVTPEEADDLPGIVQGAAEGTTILLEDGTYQMSGGDESARRIQITKPGISLRSASGDRDAVIIDGEYLTEEIITVSASDVTIADITIREAVNHPIHVYGGDADITGVLLYNLHIIDGGEQFVKVNTGGNGTTTYVDDGRLECSLFEMTDDGRPNVERDPGGCYTGGIDAHQARGWVVRRNTFRDIYCETEGLAEHAIHFWRNSRDTLVEQNTIVKCARGVGFGLQQDSGGGEIRSYDDDPYPGGGYIGHYDGIIRNNLISISEGSTWFDSGIELEQARGTRIYHNTIIHPATSWASISHRWENTEVDVVNNVLVSIKGRDDSVANASSNIESAPDDLFVDRAGHDLHLAGSAAAAIDQGETLTDAGDDIDGEPHENGAPDLGADEVE
jgi:hypothetical protein